MHVTRISAHSEPAAPALEVAHVVHVEGRRCSVRSASGHELEARLAASCLVQPSPGDRVALLAASGAEVPYVYAVLERSESAPLGIAAPQGLCISAPAGAVVVSAERVELLGRQHLGMLSATVNVETHELQCDFRELRASGERATLHVEVTRWVGKSLSTLLERVLSRVQRSYRVVEEIEHLSGKQLDYQLSENFSVRGKNNLITAEELVKLDGKQLHLG